MEALRARVRDLLSGFWALPLVTSAALAALAFALVAIDGAAGPEGVAFGFHGDAGAARSILSVVAGSLITVVGVTFSLLILTLQLVSGQFTPRTMRKMLADRTTQIVAGVFVGVVAYALIVLRSVRSEGQPDPLLPSLSTTVAIWLTLLALGLLIYFVHHMGVSIQVSTISARVAEETLETVDRLFPDDALAQTDKREFDAVVAAWRSRSRPAVAHPGRAGYVQAIAERDVERALPAGARVAVNVHTGDFVTEMTDAIEIWAALDDAALDDVSAALVVADERDLRGDVAFGLRQLADIGLRAVSPGINDPTTAVTVIGYIQSILERLAGRAYPDEVEDRDDDRVIAWRATSFVEHLELGFVELGRFAATDTRVAASLLDALSRIGCAAADAGAPERVEAVAGLATRVAAPALAAAATAEDVEELSNRLEVVADLPRSGPSARA